MTAWWQGAGFERREVAEFVTAAQGRAGTTGSGGHAGRVVVRPVAMTLPEKPDLKSVPEAGSRQGELGRQAQYADHQHAADRGRDRSAQGIGDSPTAALAAIVEAAEISRTTAIEFFQTPAELGERFRVPQLALRVQGELRVVR